MVSLANQEAWISTHSLSKVMLSMLCLSSDDHAFHFLELRCYQLLLGLACSISQASVKLSDRGHSDLRFLRESSKITT